VLALRQQDHMLVVRVHVIRVLRSSKRVSSPLQDPLLSSHNANQFMLVRVLPIPRREAIPSLGSRQLFAKLACLQVGAISCRRYYFSKTPLFRGFLRSTGSQKFMYATRPPLVIKVSKMGRYILSIPCNLRLFFLRSVPQAVTFPRVHRVFQSSCTQISDANVGSSVPRRLRCFHEAGN
jgi:hypothetical protein